MTSVYAVNDDDAMALVISNATFKIKSVHDAR